MATAERLSPSQYIAAADEAVRYVKQALPFGSTNNFSDFLRHPYPGRWETAAIGKLREEFGSVSDIKKLQAAGQIPNDRRVLTFIEVWSKNALAVGAGNCAFQAAVAFTYLRGRRIFPLEYMQLARPRDHAFVILGRPRETNLMHFAEWTTDAIICDPWRGATGLAGMLGVWYSTTAVELLARLEE